MGMRLLLAGLVALAACGQAVEGADQTLTTASAESPPEPSTTQQATTTTVETTTTSTEPNYVTDPEAEAAALAIVEAAFDEYNSGDPRVWAEIRDRGSGYAQEQFRTSEINARTEELRGVRAARGQIVVSDCVSQGNGRWIGIADAGPVEGYLITCETTSTDALRDAAGLQLRETYSWVVADGEVIAVSSSGVNEAEDEAFWNLIPAFDAWLRTEHPDVWEEIEFVSSFGELFFPTADSVPLALEWIDDYVDTLN